MAMDFGNMMQVMNAWNKFKSNHPKFPAFCKAVASRGIQADTIIEVAITTPSGEKIETNIKVKESDLELMKELSKLQR